METNKTITTGRLAEIMQVSSVTVINWTKRSGLPCHRIGRGPRKIRVEDARNFLEEQNVPVPEELQPPVVKKAARIR